ncbi:unnamed protein product, partial [Symbiodinium sp. CCMP2456]
AKIQELMDYRRVVNKFQLYALVVQFGMLVSLLAFAVHRIWEIVQNADSPPMKVTTSHWQGLGKWALCPYTHQKVEWAGLGFYYRHEGWERWMPYSYKKINETNVEVETYLSMDSHTMANSHMLTDRIPIEMFDGALLSCSVIDLTDVQAKPPMSFSICSDTERFLMLHNNNGWDVAFHLATGQNYWTLKLSEYIHGHDTGFSTSTQLFHTASTLLSSPGENIPQLNKLCAWKRFDSAASSASEAEGPDRTYAYRIMVTDTSIPVTIVQGIVAQLFSLMSSLGGYFATLSTVFTFVFVRQYPESRIARMYERRTIRGQELPGDPPSDEEGGASPSEPRRPNAPQSEVMGLVHAQRQEEARAKPGLPALPPGIVYPGPHATE